MKFNIKLATFIILLGISKISLVLAGNESGGGGIPGLISPEFNQYSANALRAIKQNSNAIDLAALLNSRQDTRLSELALKNARQNYKSILDQFTLQAHNDKTCDLTFSKAAQKSEAMKNLFNTIHTVKPQTIEVLGLSSDAFELAPDNSGDVLTVDPCLP